jgi:CheY-like chemotaxis protein
MSPRGDLILIVDDDADIRDALAELLSTEGYVVLSAEDGQAALDLLTYGNRPKVILLDLMMPRMNGLEFLEKSRPDHANIPVIVVSANRGYEASDLGVFEIMRKPLSADTLISAIERAAA